MVITVGIDIIDGAELIVGTDGTIGDILDTMGRIITVYGIIHVHHMDMPIMGIMEDIIVDIVV